jgi:hypothetical protein
LTNFTVQIIEGPLRKIVSGLFVLGMGALLAGCMSVSGIPQDPKGDRYPDRCYIEDSQFVRADQLYSRLGSLQLVQDQLCNVYQWKPCEINEALYRIRKVHDLP